MSAPRRHPGLRACAWLALGVACLLAAAPVRAQDARTPLAQAVPGVVDERASFARLFGQELAARGGANAATNGPWMHGIAAGGDADPKRLAAMRERFARRAAATSVLVVPGLFGDCFETQVVPFGDGVARPRERSRVEAYRGFDDLGLRSIRLVGLPGRASSAVNGRRLAQAIRDEARQPGVERIVLVAYSKGVPDALHALAELDAAGDLPRPPVALVSVAGVVRGTPLADGLGSLYAAFTPYLQPFDCAPSEGGEVATLTWRERGAWLAAHPLPSRVRAYSIVAWAPIEETGLGLRLTKAELDAFDVRNDGQVLAVDAILPGGTLLAEARADHWDVALPRVLHPNPLLRALASGRGFPRDALLRATLVWVVGDAP